MHNDRMSLPLFRGAATRRARRSLVGLALTSALVLTGCSGSDEDPADPVAEGSDPSGSTASSASASLTRMRRAMRRHAMRAWAQSTNS